MFVRPVAGPFVSHEVGHGACLRNVKGKAAVKVCTKCGETKPVAEFHMQAQKRDGLQPYCKACMKIASAAYRAANSDKEKARHAKWYAENRDKVKASAAKWRSVNPDKVKEQNAKWHAENPEARRIHEHNRRARKIEAGGSLSAGLADRLFDLQRGKCACCGKPLGKTYHMDHIMPLSLGGTNDGDNIQLLRAKCNLQKNAKHPIDFMQSRGYLL